MKSGTSSCSLFTQLETVIRIVILTMLACCVLYTLFVLGIAQAVTPHTANGSLIRDKEGNLIGSEAIAQAFTRPEYFWPRPSAVNYNAAAAGGSNLSPASPILRERAESLLATLDADAKHKAPADLVTTSGSGMDPHITVEAARYQAERIGAARGLPQNVVLKLIAAHSFTPGGPLTDRAIVNVLRLNLALDNLNS